MEETWTHTVEHLLCARLNHPGAQPSSCSHSVDKRSKAQVGEVTCPRPQGQNKGPLEFGPHSV